MISARHDSSVDFSRGMHALITGSSSALPDPHRGGASAAVVIDGHVLQFDCGRGVLESLCRSGINPLDIDHLFLTHLHFDHIASYGYLLISSWIGGRQTPLQVRGPEGTSEFTRKILDAHSVDITFFKHILSGWPASATERPVRELPLAVEDAAAPGIVFSTDLFTVSAANTPHYREMGVISIGYRIDCEYGSVVVTGDGRPSHEMIELATGANLLIHECAKPDHGMILTGKFADGGEGYDKQGASGWAGGHTTPSWLGQVAAAARVDRVVATHLAPLSTVPAAAAMSRLYTGGGDHGAMIWEDYAARIKRNFGGEVVIAEDGMVFHVGS